jgi:hypothetical protein
MSTVFTRGRRFRGQPIGGELEVDLNHALNRSLVFTSAPGMNIDGRSAYPHNYLAQQSTSSSGTPLASGNIVRVANPASADSPYSGLVWKYVSNSSIFYPYAPLGAATTQHYTLMFLGGSLSESVRKHAMMLGDESGGAGFAQAALAFNQTKGQSNSAGRLAYWEYNGGIKICADSASGAGIVDGKIHVYAAVRDGSNATLWKDGVDVTNSATADSSTQSITAWVASGRNTSGGCPTYTMRQWVFASSLSRGELEAWADNPWQDALPYVRRKYFAVSSGSASGSVAFSGSGSLSAVGKQDAAASAAFSGTSVFTIVGKELAKGSVAFAGAGNLSAVGKELAKASSALGGSGTFTPIGAELANGAISFAGSSSFAPVGQILYKGSIAFAGMGSMSAAGQTSSGSAVTFTGTAAFDARGATLASASTAFSGAASFAPVGHTFASGTVTFAGAGAFDAEGQTAAAGVGAVDFAGLGAFSPVASSIASGVVAFSGSGGMQAAGAGGAAAATSGGLGRLKLPYFVPTLYSPRPQVVRAFVSHVGLFLSVQSTVETGRAIRSRVWLPLSVHSQSRVGAQVRSLAALAFSPAIASTVIRAKATRSRAAFSIAASTASSIVAVRQSRAAVSLLASSRQQIAPAVRSNVRVFAAARSRFALKKTADIRSRAALFAVATSAVVCTTVVSRVAEMDRRDLDLLALLAA